MGRGKALSGLQVISCITYNISIHSETIDEIAFANFCIVSVLLLCDSLMVFVNSSGSRDAHGMCVQPTQLKKSPSPAFGRQKKADLLS